MIVLLILYQIIFSLGLLFFFFHHLYKRKINVKAILEKLTLSYPYKKTFQKSIWFQVVSVGEALLIRRLVKEIKKITSYPIFITVTTLTGRKVAERYYPDCKVLYFPFDISFCARRSIEYINPKIFISLETEIWPVLFYHLKKRNIPILILNGRISSGAFLRYKKIKFVLKKVFRWVDFIGVQNLLYRERFLLLGASPDKIEILGNLKFSSMEIDNTYLQNLEEKYLSLLKGKERILIVFGSTHYPEERMILDVYKQLLSEGYKLSLLIAPRHIERSSYIERLVEERGFIPFSLSKFPKEETLDTKERVFILDTVGELIYFYALADICIVGGSFTDYGGHNILEPLYFSKPTLFGPYMENFKDIEEIVLEKKAAIKIKNEKDLIDNLRKIIDNKNLRDELSKRANFLFEDQSRNLIRNLEIVKKWLD